VKILIGFLIGALLAFFIINQFFKDYLKPIEFPDAAHNNTIAQMPIFEGLDDGNKYFEHEEIKFCDETTAMYSCKTRPGQSYNVARRIAEKKLLRSCKAARRSQKYDINYCLEQCMGWYGAGMPEYATDNCKKMCYEENAATPPECDK
jgi:hypothetical protein